MRNAIYSSLETTPVARGSNLTSTDKRQRFYKNNCYCYTALLSPSCFKATVFIWTAPLQNLIVLQNTYTRWLITQVVQWFIIMTRGQHVWGSLMECQCVNEYRQIKIHKPDNIMERQHNIQYLQWELRISFAVESFLT